MKVAGITGPTGAGKTTALRAVEALGGAVLDCDAIYKELLAANTDMLSAIEERFPGTVRGGTLDREALARIVFSDQAALSDLGAITHPYVADEVRSRLSQAEAEGCPLAAVDAIGLFESGLDKLCDVTVFVTAPVETRAERIMARDGLTRDAALARINAQRDDGYFRSRCGYELVNTFRSGGDFMLRCEEFFRRIIQ